MNNLYVRTSSCIGSIHYLIVIPITVMYISIKDMW